MIKKILIAIGLVVALVFGGVYYLIYHSSIPAYLIGVGLEAVGCEVQALTGNLDSGFQIQRIKFEKEDNRFELEGGRFLYSKSLGFFGDRALHIREIAAAKLTLDLNWEPEEKNHEVSEKKEPGGEIQPSSESEGEPFNLKIDKIDISQVFIKFTKTSRPLLLDKFYVEKFYFIDGQGGVDKVDIQSNFIRLKLQALNPRIEGGLATSGDWRLSGEISPIFFEEVKKALTFSGEISYKEGIPEFAITGFNGKLDLRTQSDGQVNLRFTKLSFDEFLETDFPAVAIDASFKLGNANDPEQIENYVVEGGTLLIGKRMFQFRPGPILKPVLDSNGNVEAVIEAVHSVRKRGRNNKIILRFVSPEKEQMGPDIQFRIVSSAGMSRKDLLAYLYFGKRFLSLKAHQKETIKRAQPYFVEKGQLMLRSMGIVWKNGKGRLNF